jgi:hypothetical protein
LPSLTRKEYNSGKWTAARYTSFIKSILRNGSNKWPPKWVVRKRAWKQRGIYECAGYQRRAHEVPTSIVGKGKKRSNNIFVDHIHPVGGPGDKDGWDGVISRLYCEVDGLQVLCKECHDLKTKEERKKK